MGDICTKRTDFDMNRIRPPGFRHASPSRRGLT